MFLDSPLAKDPQWPPPTSLKKKKKKTFRFFFLYYYFLQMARAQQQLIEGGCHFNRLYTHTDTSQASLVSLFQRVLSSVHGSSSSIYQHKRVNATFIILYQKKARTKQRLQQTHI